MCYSSNPIVTGSATVSAMEKTVWYISESKAREYKETFDSGPKSFVPMWRTLKQRKECKPRGIPLEAWIFLVGPINGHCVAVVGKKTACPAPGPGAVALQGGQPVRSTAMPVRNNHETKTVIDITAQCLQLLVKKGYEKEYAADLVKRCDSLTCTRYSNRDSPVRRLTLPEHPTKRFTSFSKWLRAMKEEHPVG